MNLHLNRHGGQEGVQKNKEADPGEGRPRGGRKVILPLKNGVFRERSKRIKKIIDDLAAIFSVTQTSADASRYRCTVKAAGLTNRQSRLLSWRKRLAESLNP